MATATAIRVPRLIDTEGHGFELSGRCADDEPPRYAFLGVRPCDLRAIAIQDRVLAQPGSRYAARRARLFIVAANCTEPVTPRTVRKVKDER